MSLAKEQIRQIIASNNLNSVEDVYTLLRDGFRDILQELMEAEPDATLGYEEKVGNRMENKNFMTVEEVAQELNVSKSYAYKVVREFKIINAE